MSIRDHKAIILQRVIQISYSKYPDHLFVTSPYNITGTNVCFPGAEEYYIFDYERHGIMTGEGVKRIYMAIEQFIRIQLPS